MKDFVEKEATEAAEGVTADLAEVVTRPLQIIKETWTQMEALTVRESAAQALSPEAIQAIQGKKTVS